MNKQYARELLADFLRGECSEEDAAQIRRMLDEDEALREELDRLREYFDALGSLEPIRAPSGFLNTVRERIERPSLIRRLFVPLHTKIPLELAGLGATIAIVLVVLKPFDYTQAPPLEFEEAVRSEPQSTLMSAAPVDRAEAIEMEKTTADHPTSEMAEETAAGRQSRIRAPELKRRELNSVRPQSFGFSGSVPHEVEKAMKKKRAPAPELSADLSISTKQETLVDKTGDAAGGAHVAAPSTSTQAPSRGPRGVLGRAVEKPAAEPYRSDEMTARAEAQSLSARASAPAVAEQPPTPVRNEDPEVKAPRSRGRKVGRDAEVAPWSEEFHEQLRIRIRFEDVDEAAGAGRSAERESSGKGAAASGPRRKIEALVEEHGGRYRRGTDLSEGVGRFVYTVRMPRESYRKFRKTLSQLRWLSIKRTRHAAPAEDAITFRLIVVVE